MLALEPLADDQGISRVTIDLELAPGDSISVTVEVFDSDQVLPPAGTGSLPEATGPAAYPEPGSAQSSLGRRLLQPGKWLTQKDLPANLGSLLTKSQARLRSVFLGRKPVSLDVVLFGLVLVTYLCTRFIGLTSFPIYFFTDEAVQTVLAADFVRDDFHNYDRDFLPTFFANGSQYNLGLSVYIQVIPYMLFGKSEWVTRGTAVLATLVGVIAVSLILKDIFKRRYWWLAAIILSLTPAWFLHSRTAFETSLMVSMYAGFLYFYLLYRYRSPKYLYTALVLGGLTFYSYSPGQMVMLVSGVLLLVSDIRYHWQNRKTALIGVGVLVLVALPYVRFLVTRGAENIRHLQLLGSYVTDNIPLAEKVSIFAREYLSGLNPLYWFLPNNIDLERHLMKGYGHLSHLMLPFFLLGVGICFRYWRSPAHRAALIAALAAPTGGALVEIGITRVLVFVIPAAIFSALGLVACLEWLEKRRIPKGSLAAAVFMFLAGVNIFTLRDALVNGPVWYSDYGLAGMQYGARQLFTALQEYVKKSPRTLITVSPAWSNGTDVVARFFLPDDTPVRLGSIEGYYDELKPLTPEMLFVVIPEEYQRLLATGKFTDIRMDQILPYPDDRPGFYFLHLRYVDNIAEILAAEKEVRRQLLAEDVTIAGQPAVVHYSYLDMGPIGNIFDNNPGSLIRSLEANPLTIEMEFPEPRPVKGVTVRIGGTTTHVTAILTAEDQDSPITFEDEFVVSPYTRDVSLDFSQTWMLTKLRLEVKSVYDGEPAHVHIWEVTLK